LCLVNKLGSDEFSEVDERLAIRLAAEMAVAHENACLFNSIQRQAAELTQEVVERRRAQEALQEQVRLAALGADVGIALTQSSSLQGMLHQGAEIFVRHLEAAFARIWTLNRQEDMLELQASAGMYTHLDGPHSRVPVGQFKIGLIAQEHQPHLTNAVIGDPLVGDQGWARREGMIAFAEYPLLVGDRLVGVVAMFARHVLTEATLEAIAAVANTIALGIERKRGEEVLRSSEERYRSLIEGSIQGIMIQRNFKLLFVNRAYANIFGYTPEEIIALDTITGLFAPEEHARLHPYHDARMRGEVAPHQYEFQGVRKDGSVICVETLARLVEWEGEPATQTTIVDITARRQAEAERERLREQLFQAQKMEAIGTLAGGIAHDFNNLLGTILGYSEMALEDVPRDSAVHWNLQEILSAGKRARDLVRQILTFSRRTEHERQPIQLHLIISEALRFLRPSLPATIEIHQHYDTTASTILADPTQMHQVLMNLCTNAAYAMCETGGVLEVRLEAVEVTADFATAHPPLSPGPYARLTVQDTGHGMESDILEHIFEPFFTTKPVGEGTGLGLPVVHGIVANHGGAVTVTSVPRQGTTFHIYLPRFDNTSGENIPEIETIRGNERILFVDDEAALARWGEQTLERLGYDVVACTSSVEALNRFRAAPQGFDLLITDRTMPGMTGEVLAREVKRIRPDLPIILCTSFSTTMTREEAETMGIQAYLVKPIMRQDLALAIRQVLDRQDA
jgi:PAS domain S-box-containing protein